MHTDTNRSTNQPASDLEAAKVLGRLIEFGHQTHPLPPLPPVWQTLYTAVWRALLHGRNARRRIFQNALAGLLQDDDQLDVAAMHTLVYQNTLNTEDRTQQNRDYYSADDALTDPPPLTWCVRDLFAQPSLNILVGDPGSKKTYLALDLAVCVAMGKPWLGRAVGTPVGAGSPRPILSSVGTGLKTCPPSPDQSVGTGLETCPQPVLLIDEEAGLHQLWTRLNASLHAHQAAAGTPLKFSSLSGHDLRDPFQAEQLIQRAIALDARLIVIDSLSGLLRGIPEGSQGTMQPVLFQLRRLAEYCRAAVVVLHHTNRHGFFRGSSLISAAADLMLSIQSAPDDTLIELHTLKARFLAPAPFAARAHFTTDPATGNPRFHLTEESVIPSGGASLGESRAAHSNSKQVSRLRTAPIHETTGTAFAILEFLSAHQPSSRAQLAAALTNHSPGTIRNVLHQLKVSGLIKRTTSDGKGKKAVYELSQKGQARLDLK